MNTRAQVLLRPLRRSISTFLLVAALGLTMDFISATIVEPSFSYLGFRYSSAAWSTELLVVLMTTVVALALPRALARPSHVVLWTIFVVCVVPTMLMSISTTYLSAPTALLLSAAVGLAFSAVAVTTPQHPLTAPEPLHGDSIRFRGATISRGALTWTFCAAHSLATYGLMAATVGVHLRFLALDDIYDARADYVSDVGGGPLGYLLTGQAYVVNPLLLARGLFRRRPSLVVLAVVGQFLLYSSTGFKAVLFSFIAVLGMATLFRNAKPRRSVAFLAAPLVIMIVSAIADRAQGGLTWTSVFTRRFMLTPGLLSSVYVDYFSDNPVAAYGYSFLKTWVDYPYDLPPPKRIADFMLPGSTGYANANLFADGFANFGWAGIFIAAAALWVWLRYLDRASRGLPLRVSAMAVVMPSIMLSNTSIFTAMLSHGLLMGTLVLLLAPRTGWTRRSAPDGADARPRQAADDGGKSTRRTVGAPRPGRVVSIPRHSAPMAARRRSITASRVGRRRGPAARHAPL